MERTLQKDVTDALQALLEIWFVAKNTGDIEDLRFLIECTEKYDSLCKQLEEQKIKLDDMELE